MPPSKIKSRKRKITFTLNADTATQIALVGDFNKWNQTSHPLKKNKKGIWEKSLMLDVGSYEYKYLVDGYWQNDPQNAAVCWNCFGTLNNVLTVTAS